MKIAVDVQSLYDSKPSGVGHYVLEVLSAIELNPGAELVLFSRGSRVLVLPESILKKSHVRHVHRRIPNKLINALIGLGAVSLEQLLGESVDKVWFPNTGYLPRTKARTILTVHDLAWHIMPETYSLMHHIRYRITQARSSIKTAGHIIAASDSTKRDVMSQFNRASDDVSTVHHGVDQQIFHNKVLPSDSTRRQKLGVTKPYILSLATREPRKNLPSLVRAFNRLRSNGHQINLVLAGGGGWKRKALDQAIDQSTYRQHIHVLGFVSDNDRPALLRGAACLALPSRYEGFGMQILEAMACGAPVVTTKNSSLLEVGSDAVLSTRAMNTNELTQTLDRLLYDETLQHELSKRGVNRAKIFNWNSCAMQTIAALEK